MRRIVVLGVDVGTTATKTTAFATDGAALAGAAHPYPLDVARPGRAEQDPELVLGAVLRTIRTTAAACRELDLDVAGIAVSTAMHGLCALDGDDRPLTPVLTWADTRARAQADAIRAADPGVHDRTGTPVHPMAPLAKLAWFRDEDPRTFGAARRWVGVKELVLHALTGRWAIDASVASGTGLWNASTRDWDAGALRLAGIDAGLLAPVVATTTILGGLTAHTAAAVALPGDTPVVAGAGDGPLANVGVGALRPGLAACSIGTSGALRLTVDRPGVDPRRRLFSYVLDDGRWVTGGAISNGGSVLRWVGDALAPDLGSGAEDALLALASDVPAGSDGLVLLPSLLAERAPTWRGDARGAYVGLTAGHGRGHLVRAAVEGVCLQLALVLESLREAGHAVDELRATGGFARSPFWRQLLADVLGLPVGFPQQHDGSALGAAVVGMHALRLVDDADDLAGRIAIAETRVPDPATAGRYAALLPVFAGLQDALEPGLRDLRRLSGDA
ncbi:gluconokinase [Patulibacter sp.]|uniref:gluconokinase n=1 Tax=Patulibacter sp. TaxID=1912859 RepID=UPI002715BE5A|nr:gluconokinase [Patulibacter sp.]MDO9409729.1 gluconokinase [Patulibacter sp.]